MEEKNKVVYLVDYIHNNQTVQSLNPDQFEFKELNNEKILWKRVQAFLMDFSFIVTAKILIDTAYAIFVKTFLVSLTSAQQTHMIQANIGIHLTIFLIVFWGYFLFTNYSLNGQTLGKMWYKLHVISDDFIYDQASLNHSPTFLQSMRRTLGYFIGYLSFGTFFSFAFFSEDKRGIPDYLSQSRTVTEKWLLAMLEHKKHTKEHVVIDVNSLDRAA